MSTACECLTFAAMQVTVRKGTKEDMPAVHALICELALYEKAPEEVTNTVEDMLADGFGDSPVFHCLVAEVDQLVVGMAIYFIKYSTWKGKGVYLDDIVVTDAYRGCGIGHQLFISLAKECAMLGANQLHWQVLDWNEPAIRFYKRFSAMLDSEWVNCKLDSNGIRRVAALNELGKEEGV
jgi:GNAT superfamily N-acetyltransferase